MVRHPWNYPRGRKTFHRYKIHPQRKLPDNVSRYLPELLLGCTRQFDMHTRSVPFAGTVKPSREGGGVCPTVCRSAAGRRLRPYRQSNGMLNQAASAQLSDLGCDPLAESAIVVDPGLPAPMGERRQAQGMKHGSTVREDGLPIQAPPAITSHRRVLWCARRFVRHFMRAPNERAITEIRQFLHHAPRSGESASSIKMYVASLHFL